MTLNNGLGQRIVEDAIARVQEKGIEGAEPSDKLLVSIYWLFLSELPRVLREELRPGTIERRWWPIASDMPVRDVVIKVVLPAGIITSTAAVLSAFVVRLAG